MVPEDSLLLTDPTASASVPGINKLMPACLKIEMNFQKQICKYYVIHYTFIFASSIVYQREDYFEYFLSFFFF